ncbi:unnamed protein product [Notodromas monacha]|uniref:Uncharacterized protein n=1 Tax=Notodromas monacha TaxID=399045 RepID=A0A7R9GAT1_9CRUS|nr:unnamed protein product [Notodromas monacha]CAG0915779.1 unnamed protein product [Notodromas monacha]
MMGQLWKRIPWCGRRASAVYVVWAAASFVAGGILSGDRNARMRQFPKSASGRRKAQHGGKSSRDANWEGGPQGFPNEEHGLARNDVEYDGLAPPDAGQADLGGVGGGSVAVDGADSCPVRIPCVINDEYSIECRRLDAEVYVPFSFLRKYFEDVDLDGGVLVEFTVVLTNPFNPVPNAGAWNPSECRRFDVCSTRNVRTRPVLI